MDHINLNEPKIMAAKQACKKWSIDDSTLRRKVGNFPSGTLRKFGKQWVVTEDGMISVFGNIKLKDDG